MTFNPQDAFAKLVEDVRIGQIGRPVGDRAGGTRFIPYRPEIVLDNLPVFHMAAVPQIEPAAINAAQTAIMQRQFHLPYPRCAFLMSLPGEHPGMRHLPPRMRVRHSYVIVAEEDDETLHFVPFMRNELIDHWVRQLFDVYVPLGGSLDDVSVTYDPAWGTFPPEFIHNVEQSLWTRLQIILSFVHRMMRRNDPGSATVVPGSIVSAKINARRDRMRLPAVPQVITIDLDQDQAISQPSLGSIGTTKRPHFRKGSWHTRKATGKRSWHPPAAIHGGGAIAPPWYEVKTPIKD